MLAIESGRNDDGGGGVGGPWQALWQ